jgi:hypothetical protein
MEEKEARNEKCKRLAKRNRLTPFGGLVEIGHSFIFFGKVGGISFYETKNKKHICYMQITSEKPVNYVCIFKRVMQMILNPENPIKKYDYVIGTGKVNYFAGKKQYIVYAVMKFPYGNFNYNSIQFQTSDEEIENDADEYDKMLKGE